MIEIKKYWLKSGKGTYGAGNTQITTDDLLNDNEGLEAIINSYDTNGIVFKNLSDNSVQIINGKIEMEDDGSIPSLSLIKNNNTSGALQIVNTATAPSGAGIEVTTLGAAEALLLRGDTGTTANLLEISDTPKDILKNVTLSIDKSGNITANSFIKTGGTSDQVLLADGTVTTLPLLEEGTWTPQVEDEAIGGATYTYDTVESKARYFRIGDTIVAYAKIVGINTSGTPTGELKVRGLPNNAREPLTGTLSEIDGQTVNFMNITAKVTPSGEGVVFPITTGLTTSMTASNTISATTFTNGTLAFLVIFRWEESA